MNGKPVILLITKTDGTQYLRVFDKPADAGLCKYHCEALGFTVVPYFYDHDTYSGSAIYYTGETKQQLIERGLL